MANIVQMYRLPSSQASTYVGPIGQIVVDTGTNAIRIQDGVTPGGAYTLIASANLSDLTDKAAARSALQLLSAALHDATDFDEAGAAVAVGNLCLKIANDLSDLNDPPTARTNLGVEIGTDVQAQNANLSALSGLTGAADQSPYFTDVGAMALATFTVIGRAIVGSDTAASARTALGLGTSATFDVGSTGNTLPSLAGAHLWTGANVFSGSTHLRFDGGDNSSHPVAFMNTTASSQYSGRINWGTSAPGTLAEGEIYLQHG